MTIFTVALKYLRARTVASILTALSVTLGASVFRGVPVAANDVLPLGRAVLSRRRSGSAHLRGAAGLRGGTAHGLADRRPLLRGRRNGRVPSDGGRNPSTDPERRRPRHFLLARELLGDERDRAEDADQAPDRR